MEKISYSEMKKIIVNEEQLLEMRRLLRESVPNGYVYINSSSTLPSQDGLEKTSANGGCPDWRNIEAIDPTTTDDVSHMLSNQRPDRSVSSVGVVGMNGSFKEGDDDDVLGEAVEVGSGNVNGVGGDSIFNSRQLDTLSDGDETNDDDVVNRTVLSVLKRMIHLTETLPPKKQAMVLNKVIENMDLASIPHAWKRQLIQKIWDA